MEVLTFNITTCNHVANLRCKFAGKSSGFRKPNIPTSTKSKIFCARNDQRNRSLRFSNITRFLLQNLDHEQCSWLFRTPQVFKVSNSKIFAANYDNFVIDRDKDLESISDSGESTTRILIPGLPDESSGECSAPLHSCFWEWKPKLNVHYEKAGCENLRSPPVLFLPGFGVGSFHYENQLKDLGRDYRVWAIDFLGQGMSLPIENPTPLLKEGNSLEGNNSIWGFGDETEPWANELVYSMDMWRDQVRYFIEEVIGEPVYVVGNSLGGFVALYFAATNPHLVKGVTLLNATPFWGFLPNPIKSPRLAQLFPWSGTFPLPPSVRKITEFFWQKISDPKSIAEVLKQVYADHSTNVDQVFSRIRQITQHPAAAASFASIMFAPQGQLSFRECLMRCKMKNLPICLVYGKEDPWVKPIWGLQVKRQVPEAPYYEISPAGHCPHDEVPEVVNYLLRGWIKNIESQGSAALPLLDATTNIQYSIFRDLEFTRRGSRKSVKVRLFVSKFSLWNRVVNYLLRGWIKNIESQGSVALPLLDATTNIQYSIFRDLEFTRKGSRKLVKVRLFGSKFSLWNRVSSYIRSKVEKLETKS